MPVAALAAPEITSALIAYRNRKNDLWLTLSDLTCDLMHLATHMRTDFDRCLDGDARARLDERNLAAMPELSGDARPISNPDDTATADHVFDLAVHASDAALVLRVHTADTAPVSFSAALATLLTDLRDYAESVGFDFTEITRSAGNSHRSEQQKAR
ncbi:hypothetical protein ACIBEA_38915 [Streptomyces sp. NPDC051555]|uniref:hypothetical protein n=1 Tax=Streptomyces sp. NPDC051555 TaxID=3365657 RepID=UPI0037A3E939